MTVFRAVTDDANALTTSRIRKHMTVPEPFRHRIPLNPAFLAPDQPTDSVRPRAKICSRASVSATARSASTSAGWHRSAHHAVHQQVEHHARSSHASTSPGLEELTQDNRVEATPEHAVERLGRRVTACTETDQRQRHARDGYAVDHLDVITLQSAPVESVQPSGGSSASHRPRNGQDRDHHTSLPCRGRHGGADHTRAVPCPRSCCDQRFLFTQAHAEIPDLAVGAHTVLPGEAHGALLDGRRRLHT